MIKDWISTVNNTENFFLTFYLLTKCIEKTGEILKRSAMNLSRLFKEKQFLYYSETIKL